MADANHRRQRHRIRRRIARIPSIGDEIETASTAVIRLFVDANIGDEVIVFTVFDRLSVSSFRIATRPPSGLPSLIQVPCGVKHSTTAG